MDYGIPTHDHSCKKKRMNKISNVRHTQTNMDPEINPHDNNKIIITGQQIGLLGGPLYTTYKVLGAIHLAHQLNGSAIYWLETNDADFNEINHIDYLDGENQLKTLTWNINTHGYSCGYIEVDEKLEKLLETFFSTIRQTEFTPMLKKMVFDCYRRGRTLADASLNLAEELFGHFKIRFFTPFDLEFKKFSQPILRKEAMHTPDGQQCNCFCMSGKQRKALYREGSCFYTRDKIPVKLSTSDLVPNVKTRCICQDAFFHTHTYVAGPNEIKYIAELNPIYEFHGIKKANLQPRMSISLLEPKVKRLLAKTGVTLEEILQNVKNVLLKKEIGKEAGLNFNEIPEKSNNLAAEFLGKLQTLGIEEGEIKSLRKTLHYEIKKSIGQMRSRAKIKANQRLKQVAFLSDNLKPFDQNQERVFNIIHYMNLYGGKKFIDWLYKHYDPALKVLEI